jgi:hypothetical protein
MMAVLAIGWNWYGGWGLQVPPDVMQPDSTTAGYPMMVGWIFPMPGRKTLAAVSNSLTVDTMLPVPVAVTSKLHAGRVSVPPAENWADPVVASRYGVEVPGPRTTGGLALGGFAVQTPGSGPVHSVTVYAPVVVTLLVSVNDQLP